jgi:hypothetical protein
MFIQVGDKEVKTLDELNQAYTALGNVLGGGPGVAFTAASFTQTNDPTAAELDEAIAACKDQIYEWIDPADIVNGVNTELERIVADPDGYTLAEDAGLKAYIHDSGPSLSDQATKLLVSAAHDYGEARHQTSKAVSAPSDADAYIHVYGDNAIYAFKDDGTHRDIPQVTVLKEGKVKGEGVHDFS